MSIETRRVMFVHAHPDDETLITGGTIARCLRDGAEVRVVTCTLGEEGEVIGDEYALLCSGEADQLGGYRILELTRALEALSAAAPGPTVRPIFLGGAGRFRDSGMADMPSSENPRAFVNADIARVAAELSELICTFRPHVVVTYDPDGTYGHPDHIRVHAVTHAAIDHAAATKWDVPKLYWAVVGREYARSSIEALHDIPAGWGDSPEEGLGRYPDGAITTRIDVTDVLEEKRSAMRAHATQVSVSRDGRCFALSNNIAQPVLAEEQFVLVRTSSQAAQSTHAGGRDETDLFAGL
ncbi:N-acetyl-1-D-myo-inositol-2-amino-2-deoxy-alpha-D-glucopyranoside deacetylase [Hoyosella altamirensis]|uniref:1D-myo-inositol 2-acetamido-2-deoxy-alpha-D-glucopyranoside deacetylase n=1 Tax=Hoyosella altamirensis TaxID=616997 RepID=A0A839RI38_9ACTN|nr:N-acetyl-1-D-myo-inositol-2-amino-2-deoxy-alpha-D-glucopyranoside deacetylase [Hoyosella altamirensis]MBB3036080.1 N-acetyl-1-D-myo-inositol-2-amino-2-deoxy-alpha-D-glucopyranoside deacetylase [Hoyosella altamirensis]